MPYIKDGPKRTVHIQFTPDEISTLNHRAEDAGLKLPTYIRQMALNGKVKGYNLQPLLEHAEAVGELAAAIRDMAAKDCSDRWAYEADLERYEDRLNEILADERALIAIMTRRLKR